MIMIKLAICDDESYFVEKETKICQKFLDKNGIEAQISSFTNGEQVISYAEQEHPDLIFLDIELGGNNGIEVAGKINEVSPHSKIVFVTNHLSYAMDVYDVNHFYYILKDEFEERLTKLFLHLNLSDLESKKLVLELKGKIAICYYKDIIYMERGRRLSKVICADRCIEVHEDFQSICEQMNSIGFVRCHNSFMINMNEVETYTRSHFHMRGNYIIPISRRYAAEVRKKIMLWSEHIYT